MTLSLALNLLYLSLPLWHSSSVRYLGLSVGSHDRNLSVSAAVVFDIPVLHKLDYYYYYYYYYNIQPSHYQNMHGELYLISTENQ